MPAFCHPRETLKLSQQSRQSCFTSRNGLDIISVGNASSFRSKQMTADELRTRLGKLRMSNRQAAAALGLSPAGLHHQLHGHRPVSRQTELLLQGLEERRSLSISAHRTTQSPPRMHPLPLPDVESKTVTNVDFRAMRLRAAVKDIDDFQVRYRGELGADIEGHLSKVRRRLLIQMERTVPVELDAVRRNRQAKVNLVDPADDDT